MTSSVLDRSGLEAAACGCDAADGPSYAKPARRSTTAGSPKADSCITVRAATASLSSSDSATRVWRLWPRRALRWMQGAGSCRACSRATCVATASYPGRRPPADRPDPAECPALADCRRPGSWCGIRNVRIAAAAMAPRLEMTLHRSVCVRGPHRCHPRRLWHLEIGGHLEAVEVAVAEASGVAL
jgi:hypothetical protein